MRQVCLLLIGLLCAAGPASAQVTVDLHALDALPGVRPPTETTPPHRLPRKPAAKRVVASQSHKPATGETAVTNTPVTATPTTAATTPTPTTPGAAAPATTAATPAPPAATLPTGPPTTIALAPIVPPPPPAQAPPPPQPPISDTATTTAAAISHGLRVTFGSGEADLNPTTASAIHGFVQSAPSGDSTSFNVVAYAAGTPEDPSTARRLSLSRALAVRSALMADGVGSTHIYVRALGAPEGDATPDRVDVEVLGGNGSTAVSATGQAPGAAKSQPQ